MASIPLAIQPPQQPQGPLQQAQGAASLAGLLQQQRIQQQMAPGQMQLQQQAIQQGQQEQQLRQIQLQDAQAGMKAMQAWDGKDPNDLPDLIRQNGGSLNAVMSARNGVIEQQTKIAGMTKAQQDVEKQRNDYLLGKLQAATDPSVTDDQLPASVVKAAQDSINDGYLDPQHAQGIQQLLQQYANDPQGLRAHLGLYEKGLQSQSEQFAQAQKERQTKTEEQKAQTAATEAQTAAAKMQAELPGGALEDPTRKYLRLSAAEDAGTKLQPADAAFVKAFGQKMDREATLRHTFQNMPFDIFGGGGGAPVAPGQPGAPPAYVPPGQVQPQAGGATPAAAVPTTATSAPAQPTRQAIQPGTPAKPASATETATTNPKVIQGASPVDPGGWSDNPRVQAVNPNYRGTLLSVLNYLTPDLSVTRPNTPNASIMNEVRTLDPYHDATAFPARNQIQKEYTKSATDGTLGAINTALGHLGELKEALDLVGGSDLPALHALQAKWHMAIGDDAAATYKYIASKVGDETTAAYVKGGGGEKDREADQQSFSLSNGKAAIEGVIGSAAKLLNSKIESQRNNWQQTFKPRTQQEQFDNRWLTPEARSTLATLSQLAPTVKAQQKQQAGGFNFDAFPKVQ